MGVTARPAGVVPPGPEQDLLLRAATAELEASGFIISGVDSLVTWVRSGSGAVVPFWLVRRKARRVRFVWLAEATISTG